jgi:predicted adenylyl cyclase CyaB
MAEEIEAKVRIADPEALRRRLAERGATGGATVLEVNRLFDDASGALGRSGAAVRVREERQPCGGAVLRTLLTYKGPRRPSPYKRRAEFQTTVGAAEPLLAILEALGLVETFRFEKRRTAWRLGACEVVLDEIPHLGWFAEVEGPSEETVRGVLADLGLGQEPVVGQTYMRLLADCLAARGLDPTKALFG